MEKYRVKTEQEMIESFGEDWFETQSETYPFFSTYMKRTLGIEGIFINKADYIKLEFVGLDDFPLSDYYFYKPEWLIKL